MKTGNASRCGGGRDGALRKCFELLRAGQDMSISGRYVIALPAAVAGYAVVAGYALPALRRLWLRRRDLAGAPATVNSAEEWAALGAARSGTRPGDVGLFAFYSSVAGAITTAPELMTLPIDDHAIVRGHAVFDTCTLAAALLNGGCLPR